MTMRDEDQDDSDLRRAFAVLRREEARAAPTFEAVRARAHGGPRRLAPLVGVLVGACVAVAILGIIVLDRSAPPPPLAAMEHWIAPTDFLLDTPGSELVRTVPRIGGALDQRSVLP
jgi:hypothetical protein